MEVRFLQERHLIGLCGSLQTMASGDFCELDSAYEQLETHHNSQRATISLCISCVTIGPDLNIFALLLLLGKIKKENSKKLPFFMERNLTVSVNTFLQATTAVYNLHNRANI